MTESRPTADAQPPLVTAALGLQHVLAMLAGAIALPLLVGRALELPPAQIALLINAGLLVCGLATMLQSLGATPLLGARTPARIGLAFAALGPLLAIAAQPAFGDAAGRLQVMLGATIAAGVVGVLMAPLAGRLRPLCPAVVRGTVLLMIGIVLLRAGAGWIAAPAGRGELDIGGPARLGMALAVLVAIVLLARSADTRLGRLAALIAIVAGSIAAWTAGAMSLGVVDAAPWLGLIRPFEFGMPRFEPVPVIVMSIVMIVVAMETEALLRDSIGVSAAGDADARIASGIRAEGVGTLIAGVLNTFPNSTWEAEADRAGARGDGARGAAAFAGAILIVLGLSPKLGALVTAVPQFVLGGASLAIFGLVAAKGVSTLVHVDYRANRFNLYVVAIALGVGLVPLVAPQFFKVVLAAYPMLSPLLQSSIALTAIAAVLLNLFFNGYAVRRKTTDADIEAGALST